MTSPRDILSTPGAPRSTDVDTWFSNHADAADFVREWGRMRASGQTDWGRRRLLCYLRATYSFPFRNHDTPARWLARQEEQGAEGS